MTKKEIVKIITQVTTEGWWQPYGKSEKKGSIFIIEEKAPFFWRINPKWAEEVANKILEVMKEESIEALHIAVE
jgi:hypothetical protein